jgi:hypothetical protein
MMGVSFKRDIAHNGGKPSRLCKHRAVSPLFWPTPQCGPHARIQPPPQAEAQDAANRNVHGQNDGVCRQASEPSTRSSAVGRVDRVESLSRQVGHWESWAEKWARPPPQPRTAFANEHAEQQRSTTLSKKCSSNPGCTSGWRVGCHSSSAVLHAH